MSPLNNFNMFTMPDESHVYAYATLEIVNQISLISKIYSRYYFKLIKFFAAVTDNFFKKNFQKNHRLVKQQVSKSGNLR